MKKRKFFFSVAALSATTYLAAIMPTMRKNKDIDALKKVLYAHRGLHDNDGDAPENSMVAFRKAVESGYGIEMDVQLSKDKVPVVFHDFLLQRMCGAEGKVSDYTYEELQRFHLMKSEEKIPKFEDVLKLVGGRVPLIVELKIERRDTAVCDAADALLRNYKGLYCIESFHPLAVYWYRRNRPQIVRGQLSDGFTRDPKYRKPHFFLMEYLLLNFLTKPDFIAYDKADEKNLSRRICHGLYHNTAVAYTIKGEEELAEAKKHFDIFIFDSFLPEANYK